jgi:hypothetical protein
VGIVLVLTLLYDVVVQLIFQGSTLGVQFSYTLLRDITDRGSIALIGMALIYAGFLLSRTLYKALPGSTTTSAKVPWKKFQLSTFIFSSLLGFIFLVPIPIMQFSVSGEVLNSLIQKSYQENLQLDQVKLQTQQRQIAIDDALAKGQLEQLLGQDRSLQPADKAALLQALKQDPKFLEKRDTQRYEEAKKQIQQRLDLETKEISLTRWRAGVRGVLIAIGFIAIGWMGLRDILYASGQFVN